MEIRLIVAVLFAFAVCYVNGQVQSPSALTAGSVTLTGCNSTKLCMSYNSTCDPATNSSCFFSSVQVTNQNLTVALSGSTNGFVALGINIINQNQTVTVVFVCGNNSTANTSFFATALNNGTNLIPTSMSTVSNIQGFSNATQGLVQCIFNVTGNLTINYSNGTNTTYNLTMANSTILSIYNGNTNGTDLLNFTQLYSSNTTVNLTMASPSTVATLNITRAGCNNSTMLCYSNSSNCDPSGNSSCFFSSVQNNNPTLTFQLSGSSTGYVALGVILSNQTLNSSFVFVCGLNTTSNSSFFQTAVINGTTLTANNTFNVSGYQSTVNVSQNLVQCVFNITTSSINGMFGLVSASNLTNTTTLTIMNGTTNGTQLGPFSTQFSQTFSLPSPTPITLLINRTYCGTSKLCIGSGNACDPSTNSSCFFGSIQSNTSSYYFELCGPTTGYVGLGLANSAASTMFVCGNRNSNFFFQPYLLNNTVLSPANVTSVYSSQGVIKGGAICCVFNISSNFNITSARASNSSYSLTIASGTVNGTSVGSPAVKLATNGAVNISNAAANPTVIDYTANGANSLTHWTQVLAVLLAAMTLHFL